MHRNVRLLGWSAVAWLCACGPADSEHATVERIVHPDGRVDISYRDAVIGEAVDVQRDLMIGTLDGSGPTTFGSVRGLAVGSDGAIYVFDMQSSEVRAFRPDGSYQATLSRSGQGPGEISRGQGMAISPDDVLWINDSGNNAIIGLSPEGGDVGRFPLMVPGYAFYWTGSVDNRGVFWEQWDHSIQSTPIDLSATGLTERTSRSYYKSFDPRTESYDSVEIGVDSAQGYRMAQGDGSQMSMRIPFTPARISTIDTEGSIWTARSDAYAITRIGSAGDTILSIMVDVPSIPVTEADHQQWLPSDTVTGTAAAVARDFVRRIPKFKPILTRLVTDDQRRLWVGRTVGDDEAPVFDVFSEEGEYLGSVRLFSRLNSQLAPVIRGGRVYAVVAGEYGESYVSGGPLPQHLANRAP